MPPATLKVLIDTEQRRVSRDRITITAGGLEFGGPVWQNTWLIPDCDTLALLPYCLQPEWHTSSSGNYARWTLSDFGLTPADPDDPAGWHMHGNKNGITTRFKHKGTSDALVTTTALGKNRGVFLSLYDFGVGNDADAVRMECGWSDTGDGTAGVSLRLWQSGKVEVWKDGAFQEQYTLGNKAGSQTANDYVDMVLLPMRRRELLIYSITGGDAAIHLFEDVDETDDDPTITAAARFWIRIPSGAIDLEAAPLRFPASGYATSLEVGLMTPPPVGAVLETFSNPAFGGITSGRIYGDPAYAGTTNVSALSLVELDGSTAFVPNGVRKDCRARITLTGDGAYTPFVYGAHLSFATAYALTDGSEEYDLTEYILDASLEVPDDPGGVTFRATLREPEHLDSEIPLFLTIDNRPCQVWIGDVLILDGVTKPVRLIDAVEDEAMRAELTVCDRLEQLKQSMFRERIPFDGANLCKPATDPSVVKYLYKRIGLTDAELDLDDVDYVIGEIPSAKAGDWNHAVRVGQRAFDELRQVKEDLAMTFLWGIRPTDTVPKAIFKDPDGFSSTPDMTLYRSHEDAVAASVDPEQADDRVYTEYWEEPLEIEANEVRITGYNPRTKRIIQRYRIDGPSQDPTVAPSLRADNWLGEPRVFGVINKRFTRMADIERGLDVIFPQVSGRYWVGEWQCEMLIRDNGVPLWRGDLVELDGRRALRISSFSVRFEREDPTSEIVSRPATYTGGTLTDAGGIGLAQIKARHAVRAVNKIINRQEQAVLDLLQAREVVSG